MRSAARYGYGEVIRIRERKQAQRAAPQQTLPPTDMRRPFISLRRCAKIFTDGGAMLAGARRSAAHARRVTRRALLMDSIYGFAMPSAFAVDARFSPVVAERPPAAADMSAIRCFSPPLLPIFAFSMPTPQKRLAMPPLAPVFAGCHADFSHIRTMSPRSQPMPARIISAEGVGIRRFRRRAVPPCQARQPTVYAAVRCFIADAMPPL